MASFLDVFRSRRIAVITALGFSSGLPLLLTGQTLAAWMTVAKVDLKTIGFFASVGLPYTFKWAWAPLLDRYRLPFLGRRRGWMATLQVALLLAIGLMGTLDPAATPGILAACAALVAFLSASQDVVLDAYTTDLLAPEERAAASAMYVMGYRIAVLVTGTVALALADFVPWRTIYWTLAALMGVGLIATLFAREPPEADGRPSSLAYAIVAPFAGLLIRRRIGIVLAFVALYKFGDYLAGTLTMPFLKNGVGFTFLEIAGINKVLGFIGTLAGGVAAGVLVPRFGLRRALLGFGLLQAATNVCYGALALVGRSLPLYSLAVLADNLANAMGTGAFVAFLMSQCDRKVSATQYALLTALSSIGQRVFGGASGYIQEAVGWFGFFASTAAVALPGLLLVLLLPLDETKSKVS